MILKEHIRKDILENHNFKNTHEFEKYEKSFPTLNFIPEMCASEDQLLSWEFHIDVFNAETVAMEDTREHSQPSVLQIICGEQSKRVFISSFLEKKNQQTHK